MTKRATIIFDLDGTAIDSPTTQIPSDRLVTALDEAHANFHLCAATGRVWSFARPVLQAMNLEDPCIVSAGTQICDPRTGAVLWQLPIDPADLTQVVEIIETFHQYKVLFNDYNEETYFHGETMLSTLSDTDEVYFLGLIFVPVTEAENVASMFARIEGIACTRALAQKPGFNDILITNKNATKEHAVAELVKLVADPSAQTIGIGDGHNDLGLFRAVQYKVAMGNAVQELKSEADLVIGDVNEDGLADYLEELTY